MSRPENPPASSAPAADDSFFSVLAKGARIFNDGRFFEAHEAWEELWRFQEGERRLFLQALIQTAAAFVKWKRGEPGGTARLLARADERLRRIREPELQELGAELAASLAPWRAAASEAAGGQSAEPLEFPRLTISRLRMPRV